MSFKLKINGILRDCCAEKSSIIWLISNLGFRPQNCSQSVKNDLYFQKISGVLRPLAPRRARGCAAVPHCGSTRRSTLANLLAMLANNPPINFQLDLQPAEGPYQARRPSLHWTVFWGAGCFGNCSHGCYLLITLPIVSAVA